jgi:hypothetical protein
MHQVDRRDASELAMLYEVGMTRGSAHTLVASLASTRTAPSTLRNSATLDHGRMRYFEVLPDQLATDLRRLLSRRGVGRRSRDRRSA